MILTRVKSATKDFIKVLVYGKNDIRTADNVAPHGLDSKPVENDLAIYGKTNNSASSVILGYLKNFTETKAGETRLFATDKKGKEVFSMHFKNDGICYFGGDSDFMVRFSELEKAYNQLKDDHDALVNAFNRHVHATAATGAPSTPTVVPLIIPVIKSTGDISNAKINEIKTL